jgi:endonuclease YncB( thermonuclease family)
LDAQTLRRQLDWPPLTGFDLYVRWYRKYAPGNTELESLEKDARESKKGLWVDPGSVPPWEWRKR